MLKKDLKKIFGKKIFKNKKARIAGTTLALKFNITML